VIFNHPFFHFRPREVPGQVARFNHTWGLGGAALVLILLLFTTGILLRFGYDPFPGSAYDSIVALQKQLIFGQLIRNIHHWSANFLVAVVFLHMLRVFFSGGFYPPRQLNWLFGLWLFISCLASNFTGYLLPWDQLSYWAVTICTGMLEYIPYAGTTLQKVVQGGDHIGGSTLRIFYTVHTAILPVMLILLSSLHFWYIRKAGGVVAPRHPDNDSDLTEQSISSGTDLLLKELTTSLVVVAFILLFSALFDAPLGDKANPALSPNPAKAPWYFAGMQELLLLFHPVVSILIVPIIVCGAMASLPYLKTGSDLSGIWFRSQKGRRLTVVSLLLALVATPAGILILELSALSQTAAGGVVIPALLGFIGFVGYYVILRKWGTADKEEAIQTMKSEKQPPIHNTEKEPSRRSFLTLIWDGLGFVALGELLWVGVSFFKPRKSQTEHTSRAVIEVGAVEDFAPGSVTANRNGGFYLSRLENGGFLAMSSRCTHLGCAII